MEEAILKIVGYVSDNRYQYPKTEKEFSKFCTGNKEGGKFLKDYSGRCLSGVSRTIISVFSYSNSRTTRRYCSTKVNLKARNEMISYANCVNPPSNKKLVKTCYRNFINKLNLTLSIEDTKSRIPFMCCLSAQLSRCIVDDLNKANHRECTADVVQSYGDFFNSISSNIMNSVCDGNEENSDRCTKILKLPKRKLGKVSHKTPFPIVISIFESL